MLQFLCFLLEKMQKKEMIIDGVKIAYSTTEKSDASVYVFLHGWGSNLESFHTFFSRVENYFAFDFPGHGASSALKKSWDLDGFAEITKKILKKKLDGKKIIFVVHSFGGRVLLKMLSEAGHEHRAPTNIEQIIYTGVPFIREKTIATKGILAFGNTLKACARVLPEGMQVNAKKMWHVCLPNLDYKNLKTEEEKKTFQNIIEEPLEAYFPTLKKYPSTFIWGEKDEMAPLDLAEIIAKKENVPLHVISNAGHFPFVGETEKEFFEIFEKIKNNV